jgi:hypothetical protein
MGWCSPAEDMTPAIIARVRRKRFDLRGLTLALVSIVRLLRVRRA